MKNLTSVVLAGAVSLYSLLMPNDTSAQTIDKIKDKTKIERYIPKYNTIAHNVIEIEKKGNKTESVEEYKIKDISYIILDNFIDEIKNKRMLFPQTDTEITKILETINSEIAKKGFAYDLQALFAKGLEKRKIDCNDFSLLYKAVGEEMNWPIELVYVPGHVFVRWIKDNGEYINWETTSGEALGDDYYKAGFNINKDRLKKGIYLKNLNDEDIRAMAYFNVAVNKLDHRDYKEAIRFANNSLIKQWKDMDCQSVRAFAYIGDLQFKKSVKNFNRIITFDPYFTEAYLGKGLSLACQLKFKRSLKNYDKGLEIDSTLGEFFIAKGITLDYIGKNKEAVLNYTKAVSFGIDDKIISKEIPVLAPKGILRKIIGSYDKEIKKDSINSLLYFSRGIYNLDEDSKAIEDFKKTISLDSSFIDAYYYLGKLLTKNLKHSDAEEVYTNAIKIKKEKNLDLFLLRADVRERQTNYSGAIEDYDYVLKKEPKNFNAYNGKGQIIKKIWGPKEMGEY